MPNVCKAPHWQLTECIPLYQILGIGIHSLRGGKPRLVQIPESHADTQVLKLITPGMSRITAKKKKDKRKDPKANFLIEMKTFWKHFSLLRLLLKDNHIFLQFWW